MQHVVLYGSPCGGFKIHGPFPTEADAMQWGEDMGEGGEFVMPVHPPVEAGKGEPVRLYPWDDPSPQQNVLQMVRENAWQLGNRSNEGDVGLDRATFEEVVKLTQPPRDEDEPQSPFRIGAKVRLLSCLTAEGVIQDIGDRTARVLWGGEGGLAMNIEVDRLEASIGDGGWLRYR
jgi:hypothetical protein